jgi:hypothetical protein
VNVNITGYSQVVNEDHGSERRQMAGVWQAARQSGWSSTTCGWSITPRIISLFMNYK